MTEAQREAAQLTRRISVHHQECQVCQRGGQLQITRGRLRRVACEVERALFTALARAQAED